MSLPIAFWDTSAILPLCIRQQQTSKARVAVARYRMAVWWGTAVEMRSGLTRLLRMRAIDSTEFASGKKLASAIAAAWVVVQPSTVLAEKACRLLDIYPLRAADALQLAAALAFYEDRPQGYVFLTGDEKLAEAAEACGFTVEAI